MNIAEATLTLEVNLYPSPNCEIWETPDGRTIFGVLTPDGKYIGDLAIFYVKSPTETIDWDGLTPTNALGCFLRQADVPLISDRIKETVERFLAGERGCIRREAA